MTTNPVTPIRSNPGFEAGGDELNYNFEPYVEGAKGTIPEPSTNQIEELIEFLRQILPVQTDEDGKATLNLSALMERFGDKDRDEVEAIVNTGIANVCSGTPSAEQIAALPWRPKQRFYGWLLGTLLSPEA